METPKDATNLELDFAANENQVAKELELEAERESLIKAASSGVLNNVEERTAWLLNNYPETRDSDVTLQIKYWEEFQNDIGGGEYIAKKNLYQLVRLTSLSRARARIQNTLNLFLASESIRQQRGTLSEDERQSAREKKGYPVINIYFDESGKQKEAKYLIVASVWFLFPSEQLKFISKIQAWKKSRNHEEFHFNSITESDLPVYLDFIHLLLEMTHFLSFKAMGVDRAGLSNINTSLLKLTYHLFSQGVQHENDSGRAPLPRSLSIWKDLEEKGNDKLFLAELTEKLTETSSSLLDGKLSILQAEPLDSKEQDLIQIADLFA
ncbi:MAG: hypothetical protein K0Q55_1609, partial [Verrucomicrobia bacterium]|nr:hypothetical protein [Verrucomicrobiota bacterium]